MLLKNISEFEKCVDRLKSTFKDFQSTLFDIKKSPLNLNTDYPIINLWLNDKTIYDLIGSFSIPIDSYHSNILKHEDLEDYKLNLKSCKIEFN